MVVGPQDARAHQPGPTFERVSLEKTMREEPSPLFSCARVTMREMMSLCQAYSRNFDGYK